MSTADMATVKPGTPTLSTASASVNRLAAPLRDALLQDAAGLRLETATLEGGVTLVDAGIGTRGGLEAGRRIAEICLGGLGRVGLLTNGSTRWPLTVQVHTADPVIACLASQYAGWSLSHDTFHALGSGPGRALACKEKLFAELAYRDSADATCLVLEVDRCPPAALAARIAQDCGVAPDRLTLIVTPTTSLAGAVQVVARVVEVALHKAHELGFPLADIVDGAGSAPLPPPSSDFLTAMGRSNDAILFGGTVQLYVHGSDDDARQLAQQLPASASRDYGRPFAQIFADYGHDFFQIDPHLFSPARAVVTALASGRSFDAGALDAGLLEQSFGKAP